MKLFCRLEYEQNRDMSSRIQELESSVSALEIDLKGVHTKEAEAKLAAEKVTEEINHLKDEVKGIRTTPHHCILLHSLSLSLSPHPHSLFLGLGMLLL